jgi:hypothetical protein
VFQQYLGSQGELMKKNIEVKKQEWGELISNKNLLNEKRFHGR